MTSGTEYVIAAYGIWVLAFVIYVPMLKRRGKFLRDAMEAYRERHPPRSKK